MTLGFVVVPSLGGAQAAVYIVVAAGIAAGVALSVVRAGDRSWARIAVGVLVALIVLLAFRELPSGASTRRAQFNAQRSYDEQSSLAAAQRGVHVAPGFLAFLDARLPPRASFAVVAGPRIHTSAPHSWAQWQLLPRVEDYARPCKAAWLVFVDHPPRLAGLKAAQTAQYVPGYSLARVAAPCT